MTNGASLDAIFAFIVIFLLVFGGGVLVLAAQFDVDPKLAALSMLLPAALLAALGAANKVTRQFFAQSFSP